MTKNIKITNISGVELTSANTSGLNNGLYSITAAGSGTEYAYLGIDGNLSLSLESINVYVNSAHTLDGGVQYYKEGTISATGSWINKSANDFSFSTAEAQTYNNILTKSEEIDSTPIRVKLTVNGACTIHIKAIKR